MVNIQKRVWSFLVKEWNDELGFIRVARIKRVNRLKLKRKAKQKEEAHKIAIARNKADNKTYYVLMNHRNIFVALNKQEIEMYQKLGYFKKGFDYFSLAKHATYIVSGRS